MSILPTLPTHNKLITNHFVTKYPGFKINKSQVGSRETANSTAAQQEEPMSQPDRFGFLHIDLNISFASVEQHLHPEFRNRPLAVGCRSFFLCLACIRIKIAAQPVAAESPHRIKQRPSHAA